MSRTIYMMACGHASNATCDGGPACAICGCTTPLRLVSGMEGLEGRRAKCSSCGRETDSKWELPFFERTEQAFDRYYCGCRGWD